MPGPTTDVETVSVAQSSSLDIDKVLDSNADGDVSGTVTLNDVLTYSVTVENTGTTSLNNVVVTDSLITPSSQTCATVLPGATCVLTGDYTVDQDDVDAGTITNTGSVTSTEVPGPTTDVETVSVAQIATYTVVKNVDIPSLSVPGTLSYTIDVENTGNVRLTGVTPTDTLPDGSTGILSGPTGDAGTTGTLDIGEIWQYTISYFVSQVDIDAGTTLTNTVSVATNETGPESDTADTEIDASSSMTVVKTQTSANPINAPGVITYEIVVTNTGQTSLTNVVATDTLPGAGSGVALSGQVESITSDGILEVGETWTYTTNYTATQEDIDVGTDLTNLVEVVTTEIPAAVSDTAVTEIDAVSSLSVDKSTVTTSISAPGAIAYTIDVANTGDTSLTNVAVTDTLPDGSTGNVVGPTTDTGTVGVLDVGEIWGYTISYNATQADIDAGGTLTNSVSVISDQVTTPVVDTAETEIVTAPAAIGVAKSASTNLNVVTYTLNIANPSVVTLNNVSLIDNLDATFGAGNYVVSAAPVVSVAPSQGGITTNNAFTGTGAQQDLLDPSLSILGAGDTASITFEVTITNLLDVGNGLGIYLNSADVSAEAPSGNPADTSDDITDTSDSGFDPLDPNIGEPGDTGNNDDPTPVVLQSASLYGVVWLDANSDNVLDSSETLLAGWTINVHDSNGQLVTSVTTAADGSFAVPALLPSTYTVDFVTPQGTLFDTQTVTLPNGATVNLPVPIDPSGVVYHSITREPIADVLVELTDANGVLLPAVCLLPGQQSQTTDVNGLYRFDVNAGADAACPATETEYLISIVSAPIGFLTESTLIPAQTGTFNNTAPAVPCPGDAVVGDPCEIQAQVGAPEISDPTTYFLSFTLASGDQDIIHNHIPLDFPADESSILLAKSASVNEAIVGDIVQYSLSATNTESGALIGVVLNDDLPAGFSYLPGSAVEIRAGADAVFDTADDVVETTTASGTDPIRFAPIDLDDGETVQIRYLVSISTGVSQGDYVNIAQAAVFGTVVASNVATASVRIVEDSLLDQTTIIGKVFNDRDGDGFQDNADATGVKVGSDYFGWNSLHVGDLTGRLRETDPLDEHRTVVNMPYDATGDNSFRVSTKEGTVINVDNQGEITYSHTGKKAAGLTAQDIVVEVSRAKGQATPREGQIIAPAVNGSNVLQITITNKGISEHGIPGVRLATVEGLLIETDRFGRYHIAGVDTGHFAYGTNFIIKVDAATLPEGAEFTTENPRVQRLTTGLMTSFNFGVTMPELAVPTEVVEKEFEESQSEVVTKTLEDIVQPVRFESGKSQIPDGHVDTLREVIDGLSDKQNLRIRFAGHTDNQPLGAATKAKYQTNRQLSRSRAKQVADVIAAGLGRPDLPVSIEGYGDTQPLVSNDTADGMALNRRVEIEILYDEVTTKVTKRTVTKPTSETRIVLPHGGVIWATQDPGKVDPRLSITALRPLTVEGNNKIEPIEFDVYSNYQAYISRYEITIYSQDDVDLVRPLSKLVGTVPQFDKPVSWDGYLQQGTRPVPGEHLVYVLSAFDENGYKDETGPQLLRVVRKDLLRGEEVDEAERGGRVSDEDYNHVYGESTLVRQNIPIYGSRVRLHGEDLDHNYTLLINEQDVPVGVDNNFVYEQQLPIGDHQFDIKVSNAEGVSWDRSIDVNVNGDYLFIVALANLTIGQNDTSGSVAALNGDHHFEDDGAFVDGRIAAYMKGKVKGKYLVTAQIDTTEDDISNLGDNLSRKDGSSVFRRLDADQHYATYGDDSTTISDVNSQGAFYLRVDWDKNKALWGNYNTRFTGTEYAQYNRSLYGAQFVHESLKTNDYGDSQTAVYAFASEAQTANAHNEFLATGGSLYYLRETDIVRGSEKVWVEVRTRDSQRVVETIPMEEGRDYQVDYIQGRIILNRPLLQVASQRIPSIIRDQALEGDDVVLAVDYEYQPAGFSGDDITAGVRGKGWLGNLISVGGTYVTEDRDNAADYTLSGVDVTVKAGKGTWIKAEYAESESILSDGWLSANGGLSFSAVEAITTNNNSGEAFSIEGQINLADVMLSDINAKVNGWYKDYTAGFSSTRTNNGVDTSDFGIEASYANDLFGLTARAGQLEQDGATTRTANVQAEIGVGDQWSVIGEVRYEDADQADRNLGFITNGDALLGALGLKYKLDEHTEFWGSFQSVIDDSGSYVENDAFILGGRSQVSSRLALLAEVSSGDRGDALKLGVDWSINENINLQLEGGFGDLASTEIGTTISTAGGLDLYGSYAVDTDRTDNEQQSLTFGQAKRYGEGSRIFAEQQFTNDQRQSGISNTFGVDHRLSEQMALSASVQTSSIATAAGDIDRNVGSLGFEYRDDGNLKASTRLEYREDTGAENTTQWLTTNALSWQQNDHLRWLARLNASVTENDSSGLDDGQFVEADFGFAYRPVGNDRLNLLGTYTFLYDLPASLSTGSLVGQNDSGADEKMHVLSLEGLYSLNKEWELGGKIASRMSETRALRGSGPWFDSGATLATIRARYHMVHNWDALAQYQVLMSEAGDDERHGALLALYRHVGKNFKVGIGYNFTDFSDDLTDTGYDANGFFIDLTGKY